GADEVLRRLRIVQLAERADGFQPLLGVVAVQLTKIVAELLRILGLFVAIAEARSGRFAVERDLRRGERRKDRREQPEPRGAPADDRGARPHRRRVSPMPVSIAIAWPPAEKKIFRRQTAFAKSRLRDGTPPEQPPGGARRAPPDARRLGARGALRWAGG